MQMKMVCTGVKEGKKIHNNPSFELKDTTPSKSFPHHFRSCFKRVRYFPPDWLSPISEEYVAKMTPFLTLPFSLDEIFAYLNYKDEKLMWSVTGLYFIKMPTHKLMCRNFLSEKKGNTENCSECIVPAILTLFRG